LRAQNQNRHRRNVLDIPTGIQSIRKRDRVLKESAGILVDGSVEKNAKCGNPRSFDPTAAARPLTPAFCRGYCILQEQLAACGNIDVLLMRRQTLFATEVPAD
jgi:hypothetical protein